MPHDHQRSAPQSYAACQLLFGIPLRDENILDDNFWKKNLYPIALIFPGQVEYTSTTYTTYTIQVAVVSQRDLSNMTSDRWNNNDNMIDNLNIFDNILINSKSFQQFSHYINGKKQRYFSQD